MADVSKIKFETTTLNVKDAEARQRIDVIEGMLQSDDMKSAGPLPMIKFSDGMENTPLTKAELNYQSDTEVSNAVLISADTVPSKYYFYHNADGVTYGNGVTDDYSFYPYVDNVYVIKPKIIGTPSKTSPATVQPYIFDSISALSGVSVYGGFIDPINLKFYNTYYCIDDLSTLEWVSQTLGGVNCFRATLNWRLYSDFSATYINKLGGPDKNGFITSEAYCSKFANVGWNSVPSSSDSDYSVFRIGGGTIDIFDSSITSVTELLQVLSGTWLIFKLRFNNVYNKNIYTTAAENAKVNIDLTTTTLKNVLEELNISVESYIKALSPAVTDGVVSLSDMTILVRNGLNVLFSNASTIEIIYQGLGGGTDETLTLSGKAADAKAVGDALAKAAQGSRINCKICAHRGLFDDDSGGESDGIPANTIAAFVNACQHGFKYVEIDIYKTADDVYVMSHDPIETFYNNGVLVEGVELATSNYADIKNYTWDAAGKYKLSTLMAVFNTMNLYDVILVIDLKAGSNDDIIRMATSAGLTDKIMLSYYTAAGALNAPQLFLILRHPEIPLRVRPESYKNIVALQDQIPNAIYADCNANASERGALIPTALAAGIPMIFAGCKIPESNPGQDNSAVWRVICCGCMAHGNNITYEQFLDYLTINFDKVTEITASVASISVAVGATSDLSAQSSLSNDPAGFIYGYTIDPTIATLTQNTWGNSVTCTVTGVAAGTTTLRLFDGTGSTCNIKITVTA